MSPQKSGQPKAERHARTTCVCMPQDLDRSDSQRYCLHLPPSTRYAESINFGRQTRLDPAHPMTPQVVPLILPIVHAGRFWMCLIPSTEVA